MRGRADQQPYVLTRTAGPGDRSASAASMACRRPQPASRFLVDSIGIPDYSSGRMDCLIVTRGQWRGCIDDEDSSLLRPAAVPRVAERGCPRLRLQRGCRSLGKAWNFAPADSAEYIVCKDGFEHMESPSHFLAEAARLLAPGGCLELWVPHYRNPSAYRLTHRTYYSWSLFDAFPEPRDAVQNLRVIHNRIYIGRKHSTVFRHCIFLRTFHRNGGNACSTCRTSR